MDKLTVATPLALEARTCTCGTPILPYVIDEAHTFWATKCEACIKQEDEDFAAEQKQAEKVVRLGYQARYADSDFDNLHDPKPAEYILEAVRMYATEISSETEPSGRGLYLWGPNGTGKTHLAVAVARTCKYAVFCNTLHLFDALKESYATGDPCHIFEAARWAKLLVLDDLGSERPTGWVQERLYALLNTRWDEMLPTVFTSNYAPRELEQIIGARSASRVLGTCLTIEINGPDHRRFTCAAVN
jgi:DNA replication protein DnaC